MRATHTRGAYGLIARKVIGLLKHLQHAEVKTVIFVGLLEQLTTNVAGEGNDGYKA